MLPLDAWSSKDSTTLLLGFLLGGVASLCAWWLVTHGIVPSLIFSEAISKVRQRTETERFRYRFKFKNAGRRDIIDVEMFARLHIKLTDDADTYTIVPLVLSQNRFPVLYSKGKEKIITILPERTDEFDQVVYSEVIRSARRAGSLSLEQAMTFPGNVRLQIYCFGFDRFSGARKLWQHTYRVNSIRLGPFRKGSFEIVESPVALSPSSSLIAELKGEVPANDESSHYL